MPKILVLNPNTTAAMTHAIALAARAAAHADTDIVARNPATGPASIEGPYDQAICVPLVLDEIARGAREGCVATVIACFDDPGVAAARALVSGPVIGIAEASMRCAALVAARFAVVTTVVAAVAGIEEMVERYGVAHNCVAVRAADVPVLALERPSVATYRRIRDCAARTLEVEHAEAIVLGCAGMAPLKDRLARELGVPVIDGVGAAVKLAEALVALGLSTSKRGTYAAPTAKHAGNGARRPARKEASL